MIQSTKIIVMRNVLIITFSMKIMIIFVLKIAMVIIISQLLERKNVLIDVIMAIFISLNIIIFVMRIVQMVQFIMELKVNV